MRLWHPTKRFCSALSRYLRRHEREEAQEVEAELGQAARTSKEAMRRLHALDAEARARGAR